MESPRKPGALIIRQMSEEKYCNVQLNLLLSRHRIIQQLRCDFYSAGNPTVRHASSRLIHSRLRFLSPNKRRTKSANIFLRPDLPRPGRSTPQAPSPHPNHPSPPKMGDQNRRELNNLRLRSMFRFRSLRPMVNAHRLGSLGCLPVLYRQHNRSSTTCTFPASTETKRFMKPPPD